MKDDVEPAGHGRVAILGGGPAALIAADLLADWAEVDIYERGHRLGRKFLVAGEGGFNLTNSAEGEDLHARFSPPGLLTPMLAAWGPTELRAWLAELAIPTYVGSSGRVFPQQGITPAAVLKAITQRILHKGVKVHLKHTFVGFDGQVLPIVEHGGERSTVCADQVLLALGGASWPRTGSVGDWTAAFNAVGVRTVPFRPSNCGVTVHWPDQLAVHAGRPLKNIRVSCGPLSVRGEATITQYGLEGQAIYPVVPVVREQLEAAGTAELRIDLKPDLSVAELERRLRSAIPKERVAVLRLDRSALAALKSATSREDFLDPARLAVHVKELRLTVNALRPLEEAISTVGGIAMQEVAPDLSLRRHPHVFVAGEMLDIDAPTGGFLLQAAFSTGRWAAEGMLRHLSGSRAHSTNNRTGTA